MARYQQQSCKSEFKPDLELSEILTKLWELDNNKCFPGKDYEIDVQGYVCNASQMVQDRAKKPLFSWLNEEDVFQKKTFKTFRNLLDNYELECGVAENVTEQEKKENRDFIDAIMETSVMHEAHQYLVRKRLAPKDVIEFKRLLYKTWFTLFRRTKGDRDFDSSSFEHVFVGEAKESEFIGLHNWIQLYLQEKCGNIDYHGFFRRGSVLKEDSVPRLLAIQFDWKEEKGKPISSVFLGTSPEFEIAMYTICFLTGKTGTTNCQIGEYEVEIGCKPIGKDIIGTAYVSAARI
ncbi:hypothetical protein CHS0354_001177 [Potamilus streckersoni]|uniref:Uridylate-specific endoribonuclease n=1 Tax=Potamilus streckersoni TaxID=2493646 RepID=A0AAE0T633_9BIVA|nr:hypothetical protein CHS0354_001177 [Potamilus streckersoni]